MGQQRRFAIGGGGSLAVVVRVHASKESLVAPFQAGQCEVVEKPRSLWRQSHKLSLETYRERGKKLQLKKRRNDLNLGVCVCDRLE